MKIFSDNNYMQYSRRFRKNIPEGQVQLLSFSLNVKFFVKFIILRVLFFGSIIHGDIRNNFLQLIYMFSSFRIFGIQREYFFAFPFFKAGARVIYYHSENIIVTTSITIPFILFRKSFTSSTVERIF